jgi:hypothetical protein
MNNHRLYEVLDFKKGLGLQESIEVITKHSTEGIH